MPSQADKPVTLFPIDLVLRSQLARAGSSTSRCPKQIGEGDDGLNSATTPNMTAHSSNVLAFPVYNGRLERCEADDFEAPLVTTLLSGAHPDLRHSP